MKKILMMIFNFLLSIVSFTLSFSCYSAEKTMFGILSMILGITFISLFCIILGINISKKLGGKNSTLIGITSFSLYFLIYFGYMLLISTFENINFIYSNLILALFYISFLIFILCIAMILYHWIINKKKKQLLCFSISNMLTILILFFLRFVINDSLVLLVEILNFLYFTSIVLIAVLFFVYIGYKIIFPIRK